MRLHGAGATDSITVMSDIVTERLILHLLTVEEAVRILEDAPGPADRWADGFPTEDDQDGVRGFVKNAEDGAPDPAPFGCYRIDVACDGTAIGSIGFYGPPDAEGRVTVGYGLVPHSWGNGYGSEALGGLVRFCRAHPEVRTMLADTHHDNRASQRVLAKNGFVLTRQDPELLYYVLKL
jgi:RimJ/RimL family protein N-acetyltransferase